MFLVRTAKPCSSSRPYHRSSTVTARRVKDARLGTAQRRKASLMRLNGGGHARGGDGFEHPGNTLVVPKQWLSRYR